MGSRPKIENLKKLLGKIFSRSTFLKFYYNKKHYGLINAYIKVCPIFISATLKMLLYFFINKRKKEIYLFRMLGFLNAAIGRKSFYRPKIND